MDVDVTYGGDRIPNSPFPVNVAPKLDVDQVKVKGLNESKYGRGSHCTCARILHFRQFVAEMDVGIPKVFEVLTSGAGGKGKVDVDILSPSELPVSSKNKDTARGKEVSFTPDEEGKYVLYR